MEGPYTTTNTLKLIDIKNRSHVVTLCQKKDGRKALD